LCLTLENPYSDNIWRDYIFVQEELGRGFACHAGGYRYVLSDELSNISPQTIRVSVIKNWKSKREKNIKFIIK
jgi:hypothetical protein